MRRHGKLPRKPLEDAVFFSTAIQQILQRLCHSKLYEAEEQDFASLRKIADMCDRTRLIALHTEIRLRQRRDGLPETPLPDGYDNKP